MQECAVTVGAAEEESYSTPPPGSSTVDEGSSAVAASAVAPNAALPTAVPPNAALPITAVPPNAAPPNAVVPSDDTAKSKGKFTLYKVLSMRQQIKDTLQKNVLQKFTWENGDAYFSDPHMACLVCFLLKRGSESKFVVSEHQVSELSDGSMKYFSMRVSPLCDFYAGKQDHPNVFDFVI